jgi:glycosyltransferase involved in cell wall biosynthesis
MPTPLFSRRHRPRVLFAEPHLPHYRVAFLEALRTWLNGYGVEIDFMHSEPRPGQQAVHGGASLSWALRMPPPRLSGGKWTWQPFPTRGYKLVIVSQENGLLYNHWLCRPWRGFRLAFFGHGANLGSKNRNGWRERFKRMTTLRADWWFAYTGLSQRLVLEAGFPADRITRVNNAIDSEGLREQIAALPPEAAQALRLQYGLTVGHTGLFLGSMYRGKGLGLLLRSAARVHRHDPSFRLLMVGDGPARATAEHSARDMPFVHWLGALHGPEKAAAMAVSDFMALPGAVGLAIVDAFAAGLPLLTTEVVGHGPEIAYLDPGRNGDITRARARPYSQAMLDLMREPDRLVRWREQAAADGKQYTVQAMANRFGQGILDALTRTKS